MFYVAWLTWLRSADKSSAIQSTIRKVHYNFPDGIEMLEDYSTETGMMLLWAWKARSDLFRKDEWQVELGEPILKFLKAKSILLLEASIEPFCPNLPYLRCTYTITCDPEARTITERTSNKKYFKKIDVSEFQRCSVRHQNQTLIISYKKPEISIQMEKAILAELQSMETIEYDNM